MRDREEEESCRSLSKDKEVESVVEGDVEDQKAELRVSRSPFSTSLRLSHATRLAYPHKKLLEGLPSSITFQLYGENLGQNLFAISDRVRTSPKASGDGSIHTK